MILKDFINAKYLDRENILKILEQRDLEKPIRFICLDDFIRPDFYEKIKTEMRNIATKKIDMHIGKDRKNYSVWLEGENLAKLHDFLESEIFAKYLSLFFGHKLKREHYFDSKDIKKYFSHFSDQWLLAQFYEKWDKFWWHIDGPIEWGSLWTFTYYLYNSLEDDYTFEDGWYFELWEVARNGVIEWYLKKEPFCNRIMILPVSNIAWHQVSEIFNPNFRRYSVQSTLFKI